MSTLGTDRASTAMYLGSGTGNAGWYGSSTNSIITYAVTSPAGNSTELISNPMAQAEEKMFGDAAKKTLGIHPKLYMNFVKSKLQKVETKKVEQRMSKLKKLMSYADNMGQQAMYEELSKEIVVLMRESELVACGVDRWVDKKNITKFIHEVRGKTVQLSRLEDFPRVVPVRARNKIERLKKANLFNEYWIVYVDYTEEKLKTTKEKVREKDPIVFGTLSFLPNRYYFIADWVDKYCDLTLSSMVDSLKENDPEFELDKHPDLTEERWKTIVDDVKDRVELLNKTKPSNYKKILKDIDEEEKGPIKKAKKRTLFEKLLGRE